MGVRCNGCGTVWQTGELIGSHECSRVPGHTASGEPSWPALFNAICLAVRVVRQYVRLAWLRMYSTRRRLVAPNDPYRGVGHLPRFELHVGEDVVEAESFGGIIARMREMGCSDKEIIEAAIVTHRTPRGGRIASTHNAFNWIANLD